MDKRFTGKQVKREKEGGDFMRETTLHLFPETKEEEAEMLREAAKIAVEEGLGHRCDNPKCRTLRAHIRALEDISEMGLIEFRRVKATGEVQQRFTHAIGEFIFHAALEEAAKAQEPAIMAAASF
jgi:hypothetical protein